VLQQHRTKTRSNESRAKSDYRLARTGALLTAVFVELSLLFFWQETRSRVLIMGLRAGVPVGAAAGFIVNRFSRAGQQNSAQAPMSGMALAGVIGAGITILVATTVFVKTLH
jgi:hypothetical protein